MIKISAAAIALVTAFAVAAPAFAQAPGMGDKESPMQKQEKLKEEERKAIEQDYNKTMKRLKSQGSAEAVDPWGNVRPASAPPKTEAKTEAKPQAKKTASPSPKNANEQR